ncbi:hypothetical protein [Pseudooceanicola algae]|nr:hypothetical protein [Pseudooceanicola algae]
MPDPVDPENVQDPSRQPVGTAARSSLRQPLRQPPRPGPVFLARRSYRQRRLGDAARLLPVLGIIFLVGVPLLWPQGAAAGLPTSRAIIYIFGVWALLALATALCLHWSRDLPDTFDADPNDGLQDTGERPGAVPGAAASIPEAPRR